MTEPGKPSTPATPTPGWRVEVQMPVFDKGRFRGQPVGWQSMNRPPSSVRGRSGKVWWTEARRMWRIAAYTALAEVKVPRRLGRIAVDIELRFPDRRIRDASNYEPTIKPVIDALGPRRIYPSPAKKTDFGMVVELGWGVIDGDDDRYLTRPRTYIGDPLGTTNPVKGAIILHIRQLPALESA